MRKAVADTSVIVGFLDEDPECVAAFAKFEWVTTHAHVLELHSYLRTAAVPDADEILRAVLPRCVPIPDGAIVPATELRLRLRASKKDCS